MNALIQPGDEVTVVVEGRAHHTTVVYLSSTSFVVDSGIGRCIRDFDTEGLTWIRGHHLAASDKVKALLVARSLFSK